MLVEQQRRRRQAIRIDAWDIAEVVYGRSMLFELTRSIRQKGYPVRPLLPLTRCTGREHSSPDAKLEDFTALNREPEMGPSR